MSERPPLDLDDWGVVGGGLAAVVAAFLPWYETRDGVVAFTGWGLGAISVVAVLLAGYAAARVLYTRGRPQKPDVPVTPQAETLVAAAVALLLVVYRVLDAPSIDGRPTVRTYGIVVIGIAAIAQTACAARKLGRTGVRAQ